jgi:hypothetical protein
MMNDSRRRRPSVETQQRRQKLPGSGIELWRPDIQLADTTPIVHEPTIFLAGPADHPLAVEARLHVTHSVLGAFAQARHALDAEAAAAHARARAARSQRELVSATLETYRIDAALDDVLAGTLRQVSALMEERGL